MKRLSTLFLIVLLLGISSVAAQEPTEEDAGPKKPLTLSFAKTFGQPKTEISMSVFFSRLPDAPSVATLRARVSYPAAVLTFTRLEEAYLARRARLSMEAREEKSADGNSTLELTVEIPEPGVAFPSGQLATLFFQVADEAPDQLIHFAPDAWIDDLQVTPESPNAAVEPGLVKITQTPVIVGCFFFTH